MFVPATYIYAQIRNAAGNRMPVASRVEFCIGAECLAIFQSRSYDYNQLDCYGVFGSSFLVFAGSKRLNVLKRPFTYDQHVAVDKMDRFDFGTITFAELLRAFYWNRAEWRCSCIDQTLATLLDAVVPRLSLSPVQLTFITLDAGGCRLSTHADPELHQ